MKTKNLITDISIPGKVKRLLTTNNLATIIIELMKNHIGRDRAITKEKLFSSLFNKTYSDNDIRDWLRWEFVKKALHLLRQRSNCFVISDRKKDGTFIFFVISNNSESMLYQNQLDKSIRAMYYMKRRAIKSIDEQWYKQTFELKQSMIMKQLSSNGNKSKNGGKKNVR